MTATPRRAGRAARAMGVLLGVPSLAVGAGGPAAAGLSRLAAASVNAVYVAVVVDFGGGAGAPSPLVTCVAVPQGSTDAAALAAAVGQSNIAYNDTGLLCAIDNYPADGVANCTATSGQDYYYWSYWHGASGTWSYADNGPAEQLVSPGDVEGWRFEDPGPASPAAPSPSTRPDYDAICAGQVGVTTTTTSTTAPVSGSGNTGTGRSVPTDGASGATVTTGAPPTTEPAPTDKSAANPPSRGGPTGAASSGGSITTTAPRGTSEATTSTVAPRPSGTGENHGGHRAAALAASPEHRTGGGGGGPPTALLVLLCLLVVGLGTAAAWRWRRESHGEAIGGP